MIDKYIISNSHFVYTSGNHGSSYINKNAIISDSKFLFEQTKLIAEQLSPADFDYLVGLPLGGMIMASYIGYHLNKPVIFVDKAEHGFKIKRGYQEQIKGKSIAVIDDIFTTGSSIDKILMCLGLMTHVSIISILVNRSKNILKEYRGITLNEVYHIDMEMYHPDICLLCKSNIPINKEFGHG